MIDSIFIDNYKCFSNFQYEPGAIELFFGDNGTGKSSLFDIVRKLKQLVVEGKSTLEVFQRQDLCKWDSRRTQSFEIGLQGEGGGYSYKLQIEFEKGSVKNRIVNEEITFEDKMLYQFDGAKAHLFRDDGSPGPQFNYSWNTSLIATLPEVPENKRLSWFRRRLSTTFVFDPDPRRMSAQSDSEVEVPDFHMRNLSSWLRHLSLEDMEATRKILDSLKDALTGLRNLRHTTTDQGVRVFELQFDFSSEGDSSFWLPFDALSDGQRQLVALYAIEQTMLKANCTVCIDEPDNFIALREIQPWLTAVRDAVDDGDSQLWIISHNPELIDYLAPDCGVLFYREDGGPVRTKRFDGKQENVLRPSQILARGWE